MANTLVTENQVKEALGIESFRNLSKEKVMEFASLIPNMDKDVAMSIINQFPNYATNAQNMVNSLTSLCNEILTDNGKSQADAIESYKLILDSLNTLLANETISSEERQYITKQMVDIADKIAAKDTENKQFIGTIFKYVCGFIGTSLLAGACLLGVNVRGKSLPHISWHSN